MRRRELLGLIVAGAAGVGGCVDIGVDGGTPTADIDSPKGVARAYYTADTWEDRVDLVHPESERYETDAEYAENRDGGLGPSEVERSTLERKRGGRAVVRITYEHAGVCEEKRGRECPSFTKRVTLRTENGTWKVWSDEDAYRSTATPITPDG